MAVPSLYRRYRPRTFAQVRGQDHVITALRNAVRTGTEGHAYLFSGPRGTGKTTTARILAKALNCPDVVDGEPCGVCQSCMDVDAGRSLDLFELDAASNNGVDAIRGLVERASVASPGRTKVYILDEVHMLSTAASNALLKTLEEPPEHVCFVLATTDPQKVLPTIRSRTQHFEFRLLSADELTEHVRWVAADAGLDVDDEAVAHVVRVGRGSARDTLSALDQVIAAGGVMSRRVPVEELLGAVADRDAGAAVAAVAESLRQGTDPRVLADSFLGAVRNAFLISVGVEVPDLVDADRADSSGWAERLGTPLLTKAMEAVGSALVDMRQAADPRVPLEVALIRLCSSPTGDATDLDGVLRRVEALEAALTSAGTGLAASPDRQPPSPTAAEQPVRAVPRAPHGRSGGTGPRAGRPPGPPPPGPPPVPPRAAPSAPPAPVVAPTSTGRRDAGAVPTPAEPPKPTEPTEPATSAGGRSAGWVPDRDALVLAFGDVIVPSLKGLAKAIYSHGRFVKVDDAGALFALENAATCQRAERYRADVEAALSAHFGRPVPLRLVDEGSLEGVETTGPSEPGAGRTGRPVSAGVPSRADDDDEAATIDLDELEDAVDVAASGIEKLTEAFPGAVLVDDGEAP